MDLSELDGEIRLTEIEQELVEFQSYLSIEFPKLEIERQADVPDWASQSGVYLLFSGSEQLLYVGHSLDRFAFRIADHKRRFEWRWTDLIVFSGDYRFFAPALEAFLINRFKPILNLRGI